MSPSPFLPNTQIQYAWDSTSLGYFKTCPRLYQYHMIDGWAEKGDQSVHLRFGIELHTALQQYQVEKAEGRDHEDALRHIIRDTILRIRGYQPCTDCGHGDGGCSSCFNTGFTRDVAPFNPDRSERAGNYKNPDTLLSLIIDYCDKFRDDVAKTHILKDGRPAVELSFRFELDWGPKAGMEYDYNEGVAVSLAPGQPYLLCGHLDEVVNFNDGLYFMDHKTTMTTPSQYYFAQFTPNNQMTLYTIAAQVVLGSPIKGGIIDALQILLETPNNFQRGFVFRTPAILDEWLLDLRHWLAQAEAYATVGYWPMNDTACDKFGGCRFREICSKDPSAREAFLKTKFTKLPVEDRWNPLRSRT